MPTPIPVPTNPKTRRLLQALLSDPEGSAYFYERVQEKALESTSAMRITAKWDFWKTCALYSLIAGLVMLSMANDPWDGDEIRNLILIASLGGSADAVRRKFLSK